ncbi:hypothetical protein CYMTET_25258 [Cymbomonas tetramitiformis]|uniref:Uncharacterized protein n=1 Tax=Cymbomonas tetramitiformis TaxID=36881 RepID=A0AAE0FU17_9CHLO|nr:hypothetical protein CYMTET_25258 [Cymbomonas tetramitiformis]
MVKSKIIPGHRIQGLQIQKRLPWILLGVCAIILFWQQMRLSSLSAVLQSQEKEDPRERLGAARSTVDNSQAEDEPDSGSDTSMAVEEELEALYQQLTEQAGELQRLQKQRADLERRRDSAKQNEPTPVSALPGSAHLRGETYPAYSHGHDGSKALNFDGWVFYQGFDFDGGDLIKKPQLRDKPELLIEAARDVPECIALNTNGWLKRQVPPRSTWKHWTDDDRKGLFVRADFQIKP